MIQSLGLFSSQLSLSRQGESSGSKSNDSGLYILWTSPLSIADDHMAVKQGSYSEGQNCSTKGQISLVSQIVAQRTKGKLWENCTAKVSILYFVVPNDRHLASFVDFILTLQWDQFGGTVLSLPLKVALYTWIT